MKEQAPHFARMMAVAAIILLVLGVLLSLALLAVLYKAVREWIELAEENQHRLQPRLRETSKKRRWVLPLIVSLKVLLPLLILLFTNWGNLLAHDSPLTGTLQVVVALAGILLLFHFIPPSYKVADDLKAKALPTTVVAISFFLLMAISMVTYGALTLSGQNVAKSLEYQGPARIVGYEKRYSDLTFSATLTVAYGGAWACPKNPDFYCETDVNLNWCDYYDSTGYWATTSYGPSTRSWREWKNVDMWNGYFTCADGFFNNANQNANNGDDDQAGDDAVVYFDNNGRSFNPAVAPEIGDGWPWLVNIFGDCSDSCDEATVNTPIHRDWVFRVERLKVSMIIGATVGTIAACLTAVIWWHHNRQEETDQKSFVLVADDGAAADVL